MGLTSKQSFGSHSRVARGNLSLMLSTSRKEFFGSPDIHQRALPGLCLRSHCDHAALLLPHPTHVSTGVNICECLLEPTTQQALLRCWHGAGKDRPTALEELRVWQGKGDPNTVITIQGHQGYTEPQTGPMGRGFSKFHKGERKGGSGSPGEGSRVPRVPCEVDLGAEHSLASWEVVYANPRDTFEEFPVSLCSVTCIESDQ